MNILEKFFEGEVGIELGKVCFSDVVELSAIIDEKFPGKIATSFRDYWESVANSCWDILLYDMDFGDLNAYNGSATDEFKQEHSVVTLGEFLAECVYPENNFNITNNELELLFQ